MTNAGDLYGQSLYDLAVEDNLTDEILNQLKEVKEILDDNPDYIRLLSEPSIPKAERIGLLDEAFQDTLEEYLLNFIKVLVEKDLIREYSGCYKRYRALYMKDRGIVEAKVVSAVELTEDQINNLKEKLTKMVGKQIIMVTKVDPSVIGGLNVEVDGRSYDGTVSGRLSEIRRIVKETVI